MAEEVLSAAAYFMLGFLSAGCHAFAAVHGHVAIQGFASRESMLCTPNRVLFQKLGSGS